VRIRIRIQLFISMQIQFLIRIQVAKPMRIRIQILVRLCHYKKVDFDMKLCFMFSYVPTNLRYLRRYESHYERLGIRLFAVLLDLDPDP
jgi:hypothetical protein